MGNRWSDVFREAKENPKFKMFFWKIKAVLLIYLLDIIVKLKKKK